MGYSSNWNNQNGGFKLRNKKSYRQEQAPLKAKKAFGVSKVISRLDQFVSDANKDEKKHFYNDTADFNSGRVRQNINNFAEMEKQKTSKLKVGKFIAIDCEFVGCGPKGCNSELARVSLVNFFGYIIYDCFVKPRYKVTDYRTRVSGIRPADLRNGISFEKARSEVAEIIDNKVLVGHAVHNDLSVLDLKHPFENTRDTSLFPPYKQLNNNQKPSLKFLAEKVLGEVIQEGEHSSVIDAQVTMRLFKNDKKNFEIWHYNTNANRS
ncbi:hypothetical protein ACO0SA_000719 [Hanseniaspora valbyensis]|uniref:RNA exonuclease 4 n=1 Tax=Hanseniaspora valbyensis NRRL Y-1626 TaxID=766949 RepID=A0A1B7TA47_9ASCO|nr:hypothetical protein HANVADRAFT_53826 [Hanseniaspora valbyensis NRRL Y-1626]